MIFHFDVSHDLSLCVVVFGMIAVYYIKQFIVGTLDLSTSWVKINVDSFPFFSSLYFSFIFLTSLLDFVLSLATNWHILGTLAFKWTFNNCFLEVAKDMKNLH